MVTKKTALKNVLIERDENIGIVTLNNPEKRNNLSSDMSADLGAAYEELRLDDSIAVVITTGAGTAFCAGASGHGLIASYEGALRGDKPVQVPRAQQRQGASLRDYPKVTIAAVNGYCLGAGFHFYNSHDLGMASEEKARFGLPEIMRGFPSGPLAASIIPAMTPKWAFDLCLTGDNVDARTAQKIGIVTRVVPHAQLMERALQWAKEIARWNRFTLECLKKQYWAAMEESNFAKASERCMLYQNEHNRINPSAFSGMRDFLGHGGTGYFKATNMIKWGFKE